ncbi:MAG: hypothetical protein VX815_10915 [Gemmatimonadota bacterium]|nr:hypothetical protein [Gemmatimonadota bacterium]
MRQSRIGFTVLRLRGHSLGHGDGRALRLHGVPGRGGAIDGSGPVVATGMVIINSGYGAFGQMPGNRLLAFSPGGR